MAMLLSAEKIQTTRRKIQDIYPGRIFLFFLQISNFKKSVPAETK